MLRLELWDYQATAIPLDSDAITSRGWFLYINHMKRHMYPKFLQNFCNTHCSKLEAVNDQNSQVNSRLVKIFERGFVIMCM